MENLCQWDKPLFFLFSDNVEVLVYYSHFTSLFAALIFGIWFYNKSDKSNIFKYLLGSLIIFCLWVLFDMALFATDKPQEVMFFWSLLTLLEPLIYAGFFYVMWTYLTEKDIKIEQKFYILLSFLPIIILLSTNSNLTGFDMTNCDRDALEGPLVTYAYILESVYIILTLIFATVYYKKSDKDKKINIIAISTSILLFFSFFSIGNILGTYSVIEWRYTQYGLMSLPLSIVVFLLFMMKSQFANLKISRSLILVAIMWFTVFSLIFMDLNSFVRVLVFILLSIVTIISIIFVKIVKGDNEKNEQILKLNNELKDLNIHLEDRVKEQTKEVANAYEVEKKARINLEKLDKEKDQFMVITQHQLRTPLTAFKWGLEMLLNGEFGAITHAQEDYFKEAKNNNERLIDIANKMVESNDANKIEKVVMHADFENVFSKAYLDLKIYIQKKKIDLKVDDTFDNNKKLEISEEKLYQIIYNLVDNAIKYSKVEGVIENKIYQENNNLVFVIRDYGIGIPQSEVGSLFKRFFRAKNAINSHPDGSGLGLFISKTIIDQVKGSIECESEGVDKGTTFTIKIPLISN